MITRHFAVWDMCGGLVPDKGTLMYALWIHLGGNTALELWELIVAKGR